MERNRVNRAWGREERDQTWKAMAMNSGREREGKLRRAEAEEDARPILLGEEDDDEWMNSQQVRGREINRVLKGENENGNCHRLDLNYYYYYCRK